MTPDEEMGSTPPTPTSSPPPTSTPSSPPTTNIDQASTAVVPADDIIPAPTTPADSVNPFDDEDWYQPDLPHGGQPASAYPHATDEEDTANMLDCDEQATERKRKRQDAQRSLQRRVSNTVLERQSQRFDGCRHALECSKCLVTGRIVSNGSVPRGTKRRKFNVIKLICQACRATFAGASADVLMDQTHPSIRSAPKPTTHISLTTTSELVSRMDTMEKTIASLVKENQDLKKLIEEYIHNKPSGSTTPTPTPTMPSPRRIQPPTTTWEVQPRTATKAPPTAATSVEREVQTPTSASKSWADIAKQRRPTLSNPKLQENVLSSRQKLLEAGFIKRREPIPATAYFAGVERGRISHFKQCLLENGSLPRWSLLGISFIGASLVEIVCHAPLLDRLIATMKILGVTHLANFDPTKNSKNSTQVNAQRACHRRWMKCAERTNINKIKSFYLKQAENLAAAHPSIVEMEEQPDPIPRGASLPKPKIVTAAPATTDKIRTPPPAESDTEMADTGSPENSEEAVEPSDQDSQDDSNEIQQE